MGDSTRDDKATVPVPCATAEFKFARLQFTAPVQLNEYGKELIEQSTPTCTVCGNAGFRHNMTEDILCSVCKRWWIWVRMQSGLLKPLHTSSTRKTEKGVK